jgi:hypothetical protein
LEAARAIIEGSNSGGDSEKLVRADHGEGNDSGGVNHEGSWGKLPTPSHLNKGWNLWLPQTRSWQSSSAQRIPMDGIATLGLACVFLDLPNIQELECVDFKEHMTARGGCASIGAKCV